MTNVKPYVRTLYIAGVALAAMPTHAVSAFTFDFESGQLAPWLSATGGGTGSIGVVLHNESLAATASQVSGGWHALSYDFTYAPERPLSFDMHAIAAGYQVGAGVQIAFLTKFNSRLAGVDFYNLTDPSQLPPNGILIDSFQHNYSDSQQGFAALAGLGASDPIAKVSMSFIAWTSGFASSGSQVWFDNVSTVPEASTLAMSLAGMLWMLVAFRSRRR